MSGGAVHTVHRDGQWYVEVEGGQQLAGPIARRDDAVSAGRGAARERQVERLIHGVDGRIHERNSYGNDPRNIPG